MVSYIKELEDPNGQVEVDKIRNFLMISDVIIKRNVLIFDAYYNCRDTMIALYL